MHAPTRDSPLAHLSKVKLSPVKLGSSAPSKKSVRKQLSRKESKSGSSANSANNQASQATATPHEETPAQARGIDKIVAGIKKEKSELPESFRRRCCRLN